MYLRSFAGRALVPLLLGAALLTACAVHERLVSRPTLPESPGWKLVESCRNQGCRPRVDDLIGTDLRIKIVLENNLERGVFLLLLYFFEQRKGLFTFEPSAVTVRLSTGATLHPKAFPCPRTTTTLEFLRAVPPLKGPFPIAQEACVRFFIDAPPPLVTETFSLVVAGLTREGAEVRVPELVFRPRVVKE
jgi:hypothetical protein